jgi:hypothetical protein
MIYCSEWGEVRFINFLAKWLCMPMQHSSRSLNPLLISTQSINHQFGISSLMDRFWMVTADNNPGWVKTNAHFVLV